MPIKHRKVSPAAETEDPDLVGAQHWNDDHVYGDGAEVLRSVGTLVYQHGVSVPSFEMSQFATVGTVGTRVSAGKYRISLNDLALGINFAEGMETTFRVLVASSCGLAAGASVAGNIQTVGDGKVLEVEHLNSSGALVDHSGVLRCVIFIYATVSEPSPIS